MFPSHQKRIRLLKSSLPTPGSRSQREQQLFSRPFCALKKAFEALKATFKSGRELDTCSGTCSGVPESTPAGHGRLVQGVIGVVGLADLWEVIYSIITCRNNLTSYES